eukprot:TRINITY_DN1628_c0_g1_i6.p1 TRINITY_DN1628_c0_g1~~TRINITY_DN1628_c0_g1_i6.p1  ORF type:complete len:103 (+),score=0.02 TRINITY_DN1628_c0_g1_i6:73-381(+)
MCIRDRYRKIRENMKRTAHGMQYESKLKIKSLSLSSSTASFTRVPFDLLSAMLEIIGSIPLFDFDLKLTPSHTSFTSGFLRWSHNLLTTFFEPYSCALELPR